ncbi:MAG TPA: DUF1684 domain-containing protein [Acidimicrobiia bacterium]|nr:DUF1684 domain-containing protein [Acidimicrobiia bacterium]
MSETLDLWDYRRRVHAMYRLAREGGAGPAPWEEWVTSRDALFANHPQSPVEDVESFTGLPYYNYDGRWRATGRFTPSDDQAAVLDHSGDGSTRFLTIGTVDFELAGQDCRLEVLWLDAYGGGIFLPFRDAGNGDTTYGGGRYLLDTVKGADLGHDGDLIVLDFNYAYHPSCVHSNRWSCPLAPASNHLGLAVEAGERIAT